VTKCADPNVRIRSQRRLFVPFDIWGEIIQNGVNPNLKHISVIPWISAGGQSISHILLHPRCLARSHFSEAMRQCVHQCRYLQGRYPEHFPPFSE
jgi:hypothetical protein